MRRWIAHRTHICECCLYADRQYSSPLLLVSLVNHSMAGCIKGDGGRSIPVGPRRATSPSSSAMVPQAWRKK